MENKITEGEWFVANFEQEDGNYIYTNNNPFSAIARVYKGDSPHTLKANANALLIADAGTTSNKSGLLPSELLEQRNELLEALKAIMGSGQTMALNRAYKIQAKEAIKKVEGE